MSISNPPTVDDGPLLAPYEASDGTVLILLGQEDEVRRAEVWYLDGKPLPKSAFTTTGRLALSWRPPPPSLIEKYGTPKGPGEQKGPPAASGAPGRQETPPEPPGPDLGASAPAPSPSAILAGVLESKGQSIWHLLRNSMSPTTFCGILSSPLSNAVPWVEEPDGTFRGSPICKGCRLNHDRQVMANGGEDVDLPTLLTSVSKLPGSPTTWRLAFGSSNVTFETDTKGLLTKGPLSLFWYENFHRRLIVAKETWEAYLERVADMANEEEREEATTDMLLREALLKHLSSYRILAEKDDIPLWNLECAFLYNGKPYIVIGELMEVLAKKNINLTPTQVRNALRGVVLGTGIGIWVKGHNLWCWPIDPKEAGMDPTPVTHKDVTELREEDGADRH